MIIAISNQKGGVGKTTTVMNLGAYLAEKGKKVLLIDLDPQANLTSGLGLSPSKDNGQETTNPAKSNTIYDVIVNDVNPNEIFIPTDIENLFLLPAGLELAGAEVELVSMMSRETILRTRLKEIKGYYDYVLIDCQPSLGLLTINAFSAADQVIIPVQTEYYALEGLGQLIDTYKLVKNKLNPTLRLGGVILTMYDSRTRISKEIVKEVQKYFGDKVFKTIVPRNVRLSEAPSHGEPISVYARSSEGAKAYEKLAKELIKRN